MRNNMYEKLFELAQKSLENLEQKIEGLPAPQVTVLLTDLDHYYVAVNDVDGAICETLKQAKDTKVLRMLTMWKDGCIDLPSMKFRQALVRMDECNRNTEMILQGASGLIIKRVADTVC